MNDKWNFPQGIIINALIMMLALFYLRVLCAPLMFLWDLLWSCKDRDAFSQVEWLMLLVGITDLPLFLIMLTALFIGANGLIAGCLRKPKSVENVLARQT